RSRKTRTMESTRVDLPAPGGPVIPMTRCSGTSVASMVSPASAIVMARARARRSPDLTDSMRPASIIGRSLSPWSEGGQLDAGADLLDCRRAVAGGVHLGYARATVREDPPDPGLEGHLRQRAAAAGADHLALDPAVVDTAQHDVSPVGLHGRSDVLD